MNIKVELKINIKIRKLNFKFLKNIIYFLF